MGGPGSGRRPGVSGRATVGARKLTTVKGIKNLNPFTKKMNRSMNKDWAKRKTKVKVGKR